MGNENVLVRRLAHDAGIEYPIAEGRAFGPYKDRLAHPIYNTDIEIEAIGPIWRETFRTVPGKCDAAVVLERA